jgi:diguanylate cyclase (GGDEF)-like protein
MHKGISAEGAAAYRDRSASTNPLNWLILVGILLIASIVIGTAVTISSFRQRALNKSERELENTVLLVARHFDEKLDDFEAVQKDLVRRWQATGVDTPEAFRRLMSGEDHHRALRSVVDGLSDVAGINVFDAAGQLINSSDSWPVPDINIADRDHFREFQSDPWSPTVLLAPIRGRFSGEWTTVIARKMVGPKGQFLGVVSRGVSPANFEKFFETLALGQDATITMMHRDGTLVARYPHVEAMIGQNFSQAPAQQLLMKADHGTLRLISPVDGKDRIAATRALTEFPLSILATVTVSSALADWRAQTRLLIVAAGLAAIVIAFTLFFIVRKLSKQHQSAEQRLALEKDRLDTAINNMTQGLLLYDSDARIVLCNQRYIEMYGLSPEVAKPGCHFRDLVAYRKQTGSFQGDVDAFCSNVLANVAKGKVTNTVLETADGRSIQIVNRPLAKGGWVATQEDISERRRAEKQIAYLAHYDALTALPNRVLFHQQLEEKFRKTPGGERFAVLYIDIDQFKSVNDSLGHSIGDELLKSVAARLRGCIGENDLVARLGGDEFAIVQGNVGEPDDVDRLVSRVYASIREPFECLGHQLITDASIGIAMAPDDGEELDQLLKNADLAMYAAKSDGRRTYRFFECGMDARVKARRELELDLRHAIDTGGLELHYQPVVNLRSNEIVGCEALVRWRHPVRGMISPEEFIPVAEDTGLIGRLGEWVLATACAEAANWPGNIRIAANVSPIQFRSPALALKIASMLASSGLAANRLELEITEAVLIRDDETALGILHQLRGVGVRIALDDFGTGYSSLSYLQRFPFDKIKIDRCFVHDLAGPGGGSSSIVQAVVNIAAARAMTTTAEGVETEQQRDTLRSLGCTEMQGYLFCAAKPAADIRRLLGVPDSEGVAVA